MTRVDVLLQRIDRTLAECDAGQLPALTAEPIDKSCCDLHNQHCEVPFDLCCDTCPRAVELAEFVAEYKIRDDAAPTVTPRFTMADVARVFDVPVGLIDPQRPMPARRRPWWRRWWSR